MTVFLELYKNNIKFYFRGFSAPFWTFLFPVIMLAVLMSAFGGSGDSGFLGVAELEIVDLDQSDLSKQYVDLNKKALQTVDTLKTNITFITNGQERTPGAVRLTIPEDLSASVKDPSRHKSFLVSYDIPPKLATKILISVLSAVFNHIQLELVDTPKPFHLVLDGQSSSQLSITKELSYGQFLTPGLIGMILFSISLFGFCVPLVQMRETKILQRIKTLPLSQEQYIAAFIVSTVSVLVIYTMAFIVGVNFIYQLNIPLLVLVWWRLLVLILVALVFFLSFGVAIAGNVKSASTMTGISNLLYFPLIFGGNIIIPGQFFPEFVSSILRFFPLTPLVESFRNVLFHQATLVTEVYTLILCLIWISTSLIVTKFTFVLHYGKT
jgi:ABC-2 type transport system permease protein